MDVFLAMMIFTIGCIAGGAASICVFKACCVPDNQPNDYAYAAMNNNGDHLLKTHVRTNRTTPLASKASPALESGYERNGKASTQETQKQSAAAQA